MDALFIFGNMNLDSSKRIYILAPAAPSGYSVLSTNSSLDYFFKSFQYETIAFITRQSDKPDSNSIYHVPSTSSTAVTAPSSDHYFPTP